MNSNDVPLWLWRLARWGLALLTAAVAGVVVAVSCGIADPKPVGHRLREDSLTTAGDWQPFGEGVSFGAGGLTIAVGQAGALSGAVMSVAAGEFTFEVAVAQTGGEVGAAYGIVFAYQSPTSFTAALINGNGYAKVFEASGQQWMAWQQYPHILLGYDANRVRVDVRNGEGLVRVNDEVLMRVPIGAGQVGVMVQPTTAGQTVRFGWAKLWLGR